MKDNKTMQKPLEDLTYEDAMAILEKGKRIDKWKSFEMLFVGIIFIIGLFTAFLDTGMYGLNAFEYLIILALSTLIIAFYASKEQSDQEYYDSTLKIINEKYHKE